MSAYYTSDTGLSILCVFLQQLNKVCMHIFMHVCVCVCVIPILLMRNLRHREFKKLDGGYPISKYQEQNSSPYLPDLESCKLPIKSIDSLNVIIE